MQYHRPLDENRKLIVKALKNSDKPLTRKQIAEAIGRKKSPHIIDLIEALVDEGLLEKSVMTMHNGVQGFVYQTRK